MIVLYCNCHGNDLVPAEKKQKMMELLSALDCKLVLVDDLCGCMAGRSDILSPCLFTSTISGEEMFLRERINNSCRGFATLDEFAEPVHVVGCYPRAMDGLFKYGGSKIKPQFHNLRTSDCETIIAAIGCEVGNAKVAEIKALEDDWVPWYPVIDFDRCTDCMQCVSFCPFDVLGSDDAGKPVVKNPQKCKNNCPGCARICPEVAISFPKYDQSPINGDDIQNEELEKRRAGILSKQYLGGEDLHAVLKERKMRALARKFAREAARKDDSKTK